MHIKNLPFIALILLILSSCNFDGDKNILLRLKFEKYQRIDIKYRDYITTDNDNDEPLKNEYLRMGLTIDSVLHDSSYIFSAKIDYVRVKNGGLMSGEYSSDEDEAEMSPMQKQVNDRFKPVLDSAYKFTLSKRGEIIKPMTFKGGRAILPQYVILDLGIYQITFPAEKIAIGDNWTNEYTLPETNAKRVSTYHIESIYDSTIQIKIDGTLQEPGKDPQDFSGRYYLNKITCELDSCKMEMDAGDSFSGKAKLVVSVEAN